MQAPKAASRARLFAEANGSPASPAGGLSLLKHVKEQLRLAPARSKSRVFTPRPTQDVSTTSMESDTDECSEEVTTDEDTGAAAMQHHQHLHHQPVSALDAIAATLQHQYQAAANSYHSMRRAHQANPLRLRVARAKQHSSYSRAARLLAELPSSQQQQQQLQQQQLLEAQLLEERSSLQDQLQQQVQQYAGSSGEQGMLPQTQQQQPGPASPSAGPSLPAVTLVVKMLLQLAASKVSAAYAGQLRQQLLHQVKQSAAAAKAAGQQFSVPALVHQLLPRLRSEVMAACRQQELATAVTAAAPAAAADAGSSGAATLDADSSVEVASSSGCCDDDEDKEERSVFAAPSAAAAVEVALTTAACEAQLTGLRLSSGPAVLRAVSRPSVDFESLLRDELAGALSADF